MRIVRFTDVDPDRVEEVLARIDESEGPPEGIKATGLQMVVDRDQRTAIVIQGFESADDLQKAEAIFEAMDASETPGTRVSVDRGELLLDLRM
jgi:hypothetical protein